MNCNVESGAKPALNRAGKQRAIALPGIVAIAAFLMALAFGAACTQPKMELATPTLPPLQTATPTPVRAATAVATEAPAPAPKGAPTATPGPPDFLVVATKMAPESGSGDSTTEPPVDEAPLNPDPIPTRVVASGPVNRIAIAGIDGSLYTVDPDGSDRRRISPVNTERGDTDYAGVFTWPVWSPDGGSVLFSAVRPAQPAAPISLMRAPADGSGVAVTLFVDHPETNGIGNSVPHYAAWSPDGERIAVIAGTGVELITATFDGETGEDRYMVATGAPVYLDWGPRSSRLAIHVAGALYTVGYDGEGFTSVFDGQGMQFLAPQFLGDSGGFLHGDASSGDVTVVTSGLAEGESSVLGASAGVAAFRASPDGGSVALLRGEFHRLYRSLALVGIEDEEEVTLIERRIRAAWWSPDGSKIAVASPSSRLQGGIEWSIWDIAEGEESFAALMLPTPEFDFVQSFFEQYDNSVSLWSPDSAHIVMAGVVVTNAVDPALDLPFQLPEQPREEVWVIDTRGIDPPTVVGDGYLGFWSPR